MFDFSNYSKNLNFFDGTNKKVIGKMKDKFGGVIVDEFIALKSKMYSMKKIDGKEYNAAKWVNIATDLTNLKIFCLIKKLLDTKWEKFEVKSIN